MESYGWDKLMWYHTNKAIAYSAYQLSLLCKYVLSCYFYLEIGTLLEGAEKHIKYKK